MPTILIEKPTIHKTRLLYSLLNFLLERYEATHFKKILITRAMKQKSYLIFLSKVAGREGSKVVAN